MGAGTEPAVAASDEEGGPEPGTGRLSVRCWGTRGSIPSPGPGTAGYGGNTSCVEVVADDRRVIFDAGTGIRLLGQKLAQDDGPVRVHIFLTHFHWDHIQGFPFFAPLYDPEAELSIHGPEQEDLDIQTLFAGQMGPVYFPIPFEAVAAKIEFRHMNEDAWDAGDVRVRSIRVRHPSFTVGYRLDAPGGSVCYVPDNELAGDGYPVGDDWRDRLVAFLDGADLLFHDAMFTEEEYPSRLGWGHSTYRQTLELAREAGVKRLFFFHHAPERSDAELNPILERLRNDAAERELDVEVNAAFEGKELRIEET